MGNREKAIVILGVIASITSLVMGIARTATVSEKIKVKPDYERLAYLLSAKQFTKAERQTYRVMLLALGKNPKYSEPVELKKRDIAKLPCEDLRKIEKIWHPYNPEKIQFRNRVISWENDQKEINSAIINRLGDCQLQELKTVQVKPN